MTQRQLLLPLAPHKVACIKVRHLRDVIRITGGIEITISFPRGERRRAVVRVKHPDGIVVHRERVVG